MYEKYEKGNKKTTFRFKVENNLEIDFIRFGLLFHFDMSLFENFHKEKQKLIDRSKRIERFFLYFVRVEKKYARGKARRTKSLEIINEYNSRKRERPFELYSKCSIRLRGQRATIKM